MCERYRTSAHYLGIICPVARTTWMIASCARENASSMFLAVRPLHKRFRYLQAAMAEHAQMPNNNLDETTALNLVNAQLASLLRHAD